MQLVAGVSHNHKTYFFLPLPIMYFLHVCSAPLFACAPFFPAVRPLLDVFMLCSSLFLFALVTGTSKFSKSFSFFCCVAVKKKIHTVFGCDVVLPLYIYSDDVIEHLAYIVFQRN